MLGGAASDCDEVGFVDDVLAQQPALTAFARRFHRQDADVEDLVQDTVTRAIANSDKFQVGTNLKSWLFTIMRNRFNSRYRIYAREAPHGDAVIEARSRAPGTQERDVWAREAMQQVLTKLSPGHREVLILVPVMGLSYGDAAEVCGCSIGTLKSRLNRARAALEKRCGGAD